MIKGLIAWLEPWNVKRGIFAATAAQLPRIAVKSGRNVSSYDGWFNFSNIGGASAVDIGRALESL